MSDKNAHEKHEGDIPGDEEGSAESKRIAARRRFLAGGAVALPLIMSVSRETFAGYSYYGGSKKTVGKSVCVSIGTVVGKKSSGSKYGSKKKFTSVLCKVNT